MQHELSITDYALALREGAGDTVTVLFWERTSPYSKDIKRSYKVTKPDPKDRERTAVPLTVHFNPDAVDCVLETGTDSVPTLYLACSEIDRASEGLYSEFLPKIYAYDEFIRQQHAKDLLSYFTHRYYLNPTYPFLADQKQYRLHFRIRIPTITPDRRDDILRLIATYSRYPQAYHVTTFDVFSDWPTFYTKPLWYPASGYTPIGKREEKETKNMRALARTHWIREQISAHLTPVPYFYRTPRTQESAP